ncbi:MAG: ribbon-helix-helix domain-containing protein [Holosporales bacterium]
MADGARLIKRSFVLSGHATSVALEPLFLSVVCAMAAEKHESLRRLVTRLDESNPGVPLTRTLRLAALQWSLAQGNVTV